MPYILLNVHHVINNSMKDFELFETVNTLHWDGTKGRDWWTHSHSFPILNSRIFFIDNALSIKYM